MSLFDSFRSRKNKRQVVFPDITLNKHEQEMLGTVNKTAKKDGVLLEELDSETRWKYLFNSSILKETGHSLGESPLIDFALLPISIAEKYPVTFPETMVYFSKNRATIMDSCMFIFYVARFFCANILRSIEKLNGLTNDVLKYFKPFFSAHYGVDRDLVHKLYNDRFSHYDSTINLKGETLADTLEPVFKAFLDCLEYDWAKNACLPMYNAPGFASDALERAKCYMHVVELYTYAMGEMKDTINDVSSAYS